MRRLVASLFIVALVVACTPYGAGQPDGPPSWKLAWADEMDRFDPASWSYGWFGCSPVQGDERANYQPSQVKYADGILSLDVVRQDNSCNGVTRPYLSGNITSRGKREWTPPIYIEGRVWLQGAGGQVANWPAFWMDGHNWPVDGELDVMEGLGQAAQTWHGPNGQARVANFGISTGWHVYGALWTPDSVTAYLDGRKVGTYTNPGNVTEAPQYVILGHQVGKWGGPELAPASFKIDWLRIYRP